MSESEYTDRRKLKRIIEIIDKILAEQGRPWIFILDHINHIFARPNHLKAATIAQLSFPFPFIKNVMKKHRITTIISASASNEISYKDSHDGFIQYNHSFCFNELEISILYPSYEKYSTEIKDRLKATTGGVPLQVCNMVSAKTSSGETLNFEKYEEETIGSVWYAPNGLKKADFNSSVVSTEACRLVLSLSATQANVYDRRYSFYEDGRIKPVFPFVLYAYQIYFWEDLMEHVENSVSEILVVCNNPTVTDNVKGRLFELLVVRRCHGRSLRLSNQNDAYIANLQFPGLESCNLVTEFVTPDLAILPFLSADGLYVPMDPDFPAVDLIWKMQGTFGLCKCML